MQPNRLGWVTNMSFTQKRNILDISSFGDAGINYPPGLQTVEADLHIVAANVPALMRQFQGWMRDGIQKPMYQDEFMCLYCASPNPIIYTHCSKCGAPRSFVIG